MKFLDLQSQWAPLLPTILDEMKEDMLKGQFVGGPRIKRFEEALSEFTGFKHAIGVANGTVAIEVVCRYLVSRGVDSVVVPNQTFVATAFGALNAGLKVEVQPTERAGGGIMDPPYDTAAIAVDLYGTPVNYLAVTLLPIFVDACQSLGARVNGKRIGETRVWAAVTSFYPGKNLGSMGEGGAVMTNDDNLAAFVRAWIDQGQVGKSNHVMVGSNGRMHALQAIPLYHGLAHLEKWNEARRTVASWYDETLANVVGTLPIPPGRLSTRHIYPIFANTPEQRTIIEAALKNDGFPFGRHYPLGLTNLPGLVGRVSPRDIRADWFDLEVSLPIHPFVSREDVLAIANTIRKAVEKHFNV